MEDIKKWRIENYNLEKHPRKFNSWVANRHFKAFQADLFFFDYLRQQEKVQTGKAKEPVDYVAGLLVVDTFTKKIAVVPIEGKVKEDLGAVLEKCLQADGTQAGHVILGRGAWVDVEPDAVVAQEAKEHSP